MRGELVETFMYIHLDYKLEFFNKTIYKIMLEQWIDIMDYLKSTGVSEVRSIIPNSEHKINKFQLMFGMEEYLIHEILTVYRKEL